MVRRAEGAPSQQPAAAQQPGDRPGLARLEGLGRGSGPAGSSLSRRASMVLPAPGEPTSSRLCPPAAAISRTRRACACPRTSARSTRSAGAVAAGVAAATSGGVQVPRRNPMTSSTRSTGTTRTRPTSRGLGGVRERARPACATPGRGRGDRDRQHAGRRRGPPPSARARPTNATPRERAGRHLRGRGQRPPRRSAGRARPTPCAGSPGRGSPPPGAAATRRRRARSPAGCVRGRPAPWRRAGR